MNRPGTSTPPRVLRSSALLAEVAHEEGQGRLVVMVTHNANAAAATDRVITLQDGRLGSDELSVVPG